MKTRFFKQNIIVKLLGAVLLATFLTSLGFGGTYWVSTSGNNANTGTLANPWLDMNKALSVVTNGDTIVLMPGTYSGNNNKGFELTLASLVITSQYPDEPDSVIFDAGGNSRHFVIRNGQGNNLQLIGLTLYNGYGNSAGGSILIENYWDGFSDYPTSPKFMNCIFNQNHATADGGAIHIHGGSPVFENCKITSNTAGYNGGGVSIYGNTGLGFYTEPTFINVEILNNIAIGSWGSFNYVYGGGVSIWDLSAPEFTNCKIESNSAGTDNVVDYGYANGGGIYINGGVNIGLDGKAVKFINTTILNNNANGSTSGSSQGGGIYIGAETSMINCLVAGNSITHTNPNNWEKRGAGIFIDSDSNQSTAIINSTIVGNDGGSYSRGGGIYYWDDFEELYMFNSIVEQNSATINPNIFANTSDYLYAGYNNIEGGSQFNWFSNYPNFEIESSFSDPDNGDYTLADNSFLIGRGTNSFEGFSAPVEDIFGNSRPTTGYNPEADPIVYGPDLGIAENTLEVTNYPAPPTDLKLTDFNDQQLSVSWNKNKDIDIDYYVIYASTTQGFEPTETDSVGFTAHPDTSFNVPGLTNGTTWFIKVQAVDTDGLHSSFSNEVNGVPNYNGPVWWVDGSYTGPTTDGSEAEPFKTLKAALIEIPNGDTIRIKAGTYSSSDNRNIDFTTTNYSFTDLVIEANGNDEVIFDAIGSGRHFIFDDSNQDSNTFKVKGIHFTNGYRTNENGGSILINNNASPSFIGCTWTNNEVLGDDLWGGAVAVEWGSPVFRDCLFESNTATRGGGAILVNSFNNYPVFINTEFKLNVATGTKNSTWQYFDGANGGAICFNQGGGEFIDCKIDSNIAGDNEIGWSDGRGGGVYISNYNDGTKPPVRFVNTSISYNSAVGYENQSYGGAIDIGSPVELVNCLIVGNESIVENTNNFLPAKGGAINFTLQQDLPVALVNCTIAENEAWQHNNDSRGGGLHHDGWQFSLYVYNTIIYDNDANDGPNFKKYSDQVVVDAEYNNIEDLVSWVSNGWDDHDYSIDLLPGFVDPENGDFSLSNASPLLGQGSFSPFATSYPFVKAVPAYDIIGNNRPHTTPDIGAYENSNEFRVGPMYVNDLEVTAVYNEAVDLAWTAVASVDSYKVYIGTSNGFTRNEADSTFKVVGTATSVIVSGLTNLTHYFFYITALDASGNESLNSDEVTGTPYGPWFVGIGGLDDPAYGTESLPFATVKYALSYAVPGDTIFILPGVYTSSGFRNLGTSELKNGVVIKSTNGPEETVFQSNGFVRHMTFNNGQDNTLQIVGITFANGKASQSDTWDTGQNGVGGSILVSNAAPYFENCVFRNNISSAGGGAIAVSGVGSRPYFNDCRFVDNAVEQVDFWQAYGYYGGGAVFINQGSAVFVYSSFDSNEVRGNVEHAGFGGAILINDMDWATNSIPRTYIAASTFRGNSVSVKRETLGGSIYAASPALISGCLISESELSSSDNANNDGSAVGVAVYPKNVSGINTYEPVVIRNTTIVKNQGGGIVVQEHGWTNPQGTQLLMFNNIIWGNETSGVLEYNTTQQKVRASNNNIQGASGYYWFQDNPNVSIYPLFTNFAGGDYTLSDRSYMIGAGISAFDGWPAPNIDMTRKARPTPTGSNIDIGAFEHDLDVTPAPGWVENLAVTGSGHQSVTLQWDAPADGDLAYYIIYASETDGFVPSLADSLTRTSGTETSFTVSGLTNGVTYYFRVAAVDADGWVGVGSAQAEGMADYTGPWYVATDGNDANEGSETNPFASLKTALDAAVEGDSILIKAGSYSGNNNINIMSDELTNGIVIMSVDGPGLAIFDAETMGTPHMHFEHNQDTTFKVIGLTFRKGYTPAPDNAQPWWNSGWNTDDYPVAKGFGGSIVIGNQNNYSGASPQFIDCIFEDNYSERVGGAVAIVHGTPIFKNVTFRNNGALAGGAIYVEDPWDSSNRGATFIDCVFESNVAFTNRNDDWQFGKGGAVLIGYNDNQNDQFVFDRCYFIDNLAEHALNDGSWVQAYGGAINGHSNIFIQNSLFEGNRAISTKEARGGAVDLDVNMNDNGGTGVLINNTFVKNISDAPADGDNSPAIHFNSFSNGAAPAYTLFNNIVYGNSASGTHGWNQVDIYWGANGYNVQADYNLIEGIDGHSIFDQPNTISNLAPGFNDYVNGDYSLNQFSPALEAGWDNFNGYFAPDVDLAGNQRALPPGSLPDLGAYEAGPAMHVAMALDGVDVTSEDQIVVAFGDSATLSLTIESWDDPPVPAEDGTRIDWYVFPQSVQGSITPLLEDTVTTAGVAVVQFKVENTATSGQGFVIYAEVDNKFTVMGPKLFVDQIITDPPPAPVNLTADPSYWTNGDVFTLAWDPTDWINGIKGAYVSINGSSPNYHPVDNSAPSVTGTVNQTGVLEVKVWLVDNLDNADENNASYTTIKRDINPPSNINWAYPGGWTKSSNVEFTWEGVGDDYGLQGYEIVLGTGNYEDATKAVIETYYASGTSTSWIYSGNLPSNLTWFTVAAFDSAWNVGGLFWQNVQIDDTPPDVWHDFQGEFAQEGQNVNLNAQWYDGQSGINMAQIFIRPGDQHDWTSSGDIANGGGFNGIPGQDVYTAGVEYYIEAYDNAGNRGRDPQDEGQVYALRVQTGQYSSADYYPSGMHSGTGVTDYSIVSVPLERQDQSASIVFSEFGGTDNTQWRYYEWIGSSYNENPTMIEPGVGYFLITRQSNRSLNTGQGTSFPLDQEFTIPVTPNQWNFIGNPYDFPIPLSALHLNNGGDIYSEGSFYFYFGDWNSDPSELNPFEGIIFKPTNATAIHIYPWEFASGAKQVASKTASVEDVLEEGEWQVQVDVSNRVASDVLNMMGTRKESSLFFDRIDAFDPPVAPGGIGMSIISNIDETRSDKLAVDMRPITEEGHFWDLEINSDVRNEYVDLAFNELESIPEDFEVFLVDRDLNIAQNLKWKDDYRYIAESSGRTHNLRLLVGSKEYVAKNSDGVSLYPEEYALGQNFPNPFNPTTSMILSMKEDGFADLKVYNVLGQEVISLVTDDFRPAGYYNVTWNGLNSQNMRVASGTYLVVAQIKDSSGNLKLKQIRKMLLLK